MCHAELANPPRHLCTCVCVRFFRVQGTQQHKSQREGADGCRIQQQQGSATLEEFVNKWGLNPDAEVFLGALPDFVLGVTIQSFDAKNSKDGNVWGRLFGFCRSVWCVKLKIDKQDLCAAHTPLHNVLHNVCWQAACAPKLIRTL